MCGANLVYYLENTVLFCATLLLSSNTKHILKIQYTPSASYTDKRNKTFDGISFFFR